jgi:hypothetical protein
VLRRNLGIGESKDEYKSLFGSQSNAYGTGGKPKKIHFTVGNSKSGTSSRVKAKEEEAAD